MLPDALVEAIGVLGGLYDDILVDEAQDLRSDWLAALTCALHDEEEGSIWLFMDGNQRVYDVTLEVPEEYRPFDLTVNCRNTQAIHAEVMKLYRGVVKPEVKGPPGRMPQLLHTDDEASAVAGVLDDLCGPQGRSPPGRRRAVGSRTGLRDLRRRHGSVAVARSRSASVRARLKHPVGPCEPPFPRAWRDHEHRGSARGRRRSPR